MQKSKLPFIQKAYKGLPSFCADKKVTSHFTVHIVRAVIAGQDPTNYEKHRPNRKHRPCVGRYGR
jgi:hypothetical protein